MKLTPNFVLNKVYKHASRMGDGFRKVDTMILAFKNNNPSKPKRINWQNV